MRFFYFDIAVFYIVAFSPLLTNYVYPNQDE